MSKEAFRAGFFKAGGDSGLNTTELESLWKIALNYPEMNEEFNKLSDDRLDIDVESLDTISQLNDLYKKSNIILNS